MIETRNHVSYNIIDKFNHHYGKDYTIYDLIVQQDERDDYILFNVHVANKDIIKVEYITTEMSDTYKLEPAYTGNYHHSAAFSHDKLFI